jgi:prepilin-type N-terminal cleavage/methylation domain-containing protein
MNRRGFTLIEMAIVMVIIGLVFTGATTIALPVFTSEKIDLTQRRMTTIQQALQVYVIQNGCLPCPASGTARSTVAADHPGEALNTGGTYVNSTTHCTATACITANGVVPWITLGLSELDAVDGWSHRIGYAVSQGITNCAGITPAGLQDTNGVVRCGISTSPVFPQGTMSIWNNDSPATVEVTTAAYALVSAGPDGALSYSQTTGGTTGNRYSQTYTAGVPGQAMNNSSGNERTYGNLNGLSTTAHFDDIVRFATAPNMIQKCGANACGNPS